MSNSKFAALLFLFQQVFFMSFHRHICSSLLHFLSAVLFYSILSYILCKELLWDSCKLSWFVDFPDLPKFNFKACIFYYYYTSSCYSPVIKCHYACHILLHKWSHSFTQDYFQGKILLVWVKLCLCSNQNLNTAFRGLINPILKRVGKSIDYVQ